MGESFQKTTGRATGLLAALGLIVVSLGTAGCGSQTPTTPTPVAPPTTTPPTTTPPAQTPSPTLGLGRILCFGDSLTAGFIAVAPRWLYAAPPESYPSQLQVLLAERYRNERITVDNAGLSGEWAIDGQFRIVPLLESSRPDAVVLMEGANDLNAFGERAVQPALAALENMLRDARARGARVLLASLPPERVGSAEGSAASLVAEFNAGVQRLAERQRVLFVDVHRAFGGDLSLIGPDGLHPTADGYRRIAQAVFQVLKDNFEKAQP